MKSRSFKIREFGYSVEQTFDDAYEPEDEEAAYEAESQANLFDELRHALSYVPDYVKVYNAFDRTFVKCLDLNTSFVGVNFSGRFAQTDYLLKEFHATAEMSALTNDTRVRLRECGSYPVEALRDYHMYDFKNLCNFIALVYHVEVPGELKALFPAGKPARRNRRLLGECVRVIVNSWDDVFIYATASDDGGTEMRICYTKGNGYYDYDWSYLKELMYAGAQLNLLRPREENGVIYPELTVFEPDYLVDVSAVARCFENYAESPYVHLLNKLKPVAMSEPILLGNFAGQLLDETIHDTDGTAVYADSVRAFFRDNALGVITADVGHNFHSDAQLQKKNIAFAMKSQLPGIVSRYDAGNGMVEPSFFSEMLGLQGRMDYIQMDQGVIIEQKSGKGAFPYDNFVKPRHTEQHYVQMLLYMLIFRYNYRADYERNNRELFPFLLYSRYTESLLMVGHAPELVFRALRIRNGIAWSEMMYAGENGYKVLDNITADSMNMKGVTNGLWCTYQKKQLDELLIPLQQATELEKAYYYRFLTFVSKEHLLSKLGNKVKENSGFASKWHDSLEEKLQAGNIYDRLVLVDPSPAFKGRVETVTLRFSETEDNDMSNFRRGDIVILYPYNAGEEPDARKSVVFRCTILDITVDCIHLSLRSAQTNANVFLRDMQRPWAIEHDFFESSYASLYRGLHAFLSAPKERRDLLLSQRRPETDSAVRLKGEYGGFNELLLRVKRAKELFLIIGPPGTGKTSYGMLNVLQEELREDGSDVLVMSYTNRAVDEICGKLVQADVDFIRIGSRAGCSEEYRRYLFDAKVEACATKADVKGLVMSTRVFVGTITSFNSCMALFRHKQFSLAIIDEASQILEPHLIGLLSAHEGGRPAIRKFVMIGDHKQLPAVVQQTAKESGVKEDILNAIGLTDCRQSLFERFLRSYGNDRELVFMLRKQGRMHPDIAVFPNCAFYNNRLDIVPCPHQTKKLPLSVKDDNGIKQLLGTRRIAFIAAEQPQETHSDKVNVVEAEMIAATVRCIYEMEGDGFDVNRTVGVIVPYRNQIATIRGCIDKAGIGILHDITIDTVERYQGSQRKYIVYGFTIQKYYQLKFLTNNVFVDIDGTVVDRKLNVAMTRAEEHLIMIGNAELLANNFTFFKLMEFARSIHGYFRVGWRDYCNGRFNVPQYDSRGNDNRQDVFRLSPAFAKVFDECVTIPVKDCSDNFPDGVFGYDKDTVLNAIGYGKINISEPLDMPDNTIMSPERQVLAYCHYIMRRHYCDAANLYGCNDNLISDKIKAFGGRLRFIDIGCGPATGGIAFVERFKNSTCQLTYTGIDISGEMRNMGRKLMSGMWGNNLSVRMAGAFSELDDSYWESCSELPSLVFINMSYFFSNVTAKIAVRLAGQIAEVMRRYPLNGYVLCVQHSDFDVRLNSYRAFQSILKPHVTVLKSGELPPPDCLDGTMQSFPSRYDLLTSRE